MSASGQRQENPSPRIDEVRVAGGGYFRSAIVPPFDCALCGEHVDQGKRSDFRFRRPCPACAKKATGGGFDCPHERYVDVFVCRPCVLMIAGFVEGMLDERRWTT